MKANHSNPRFKKAAVVLAGILVAIVSTFAHATQGDSTETLAMEDEIALEEQHLMQQLRLHAPTPEPDVVIFIDERLQVVYEGNEDDARSVELFNESDKYMRSGNRVYYLVDSFRDEPTWMAKN